MIVIFTYRRRQMLTGLLTELRSKTDEKICILDDGSDYHPTQFMLGFNYYRYKHQGKEGFWKIWNEAFRLCRESEDDWFLFLQDDVSDVQLDKIKQVTEPLDLYAFNIMRRGDPNRGWTNIHPTPVDLGVPAYHCGYTDCIYATNRKTLDLFGWQLDPVSPYRFLNSEISSGVGHQTSKIMDKKGIPMYFPEKSMAFHGDHPSLMHPEHRKHTPMVSK